ncbi:hypothetical protein ACFP47_11480 [Nesterenkonia lacusekhoensis]|uniref:Peptidase A2 domain-containing protein n=1 Tax=Nesterenkonia lacusekhoensis TaxID=150832 RepID=A0ABS4T4V8_9MICC|nr:hypothetical protein [Nesterenkonia lacusekhoensis]MBP2319497.1 hypothetical protein [Nesterenkonia lacusekhoensis]
MKNHTTKIAGLSLAALLALTACGDGDDADTSNGDENGATEDNGGEETADEVFEFEAPVTESQQGPYDEATVQIPDELLENEPEYAENRVLESVTLRAAEAEAGQCALEADYNYSENVPEDPVDQRLSSGADFPNSSGHQLEPSNGEIVEELVTETIDQDTHDYRGATFTYGVVQDDPNLTYSKMLGVTQSEDAFSKESFSEDFSTVTHDLTCSGETAPIQFRTAEWEEESADEIGRNSTNLTDEGHQELVDTGATWTTMSVSSSAFAEVEAGVDSEGNITLYAPGIDGWEYDSNGNWISN